MPRPAARRRPARGHAARAGAGPPARSRSPSAPRRRVRRRPGRARPQPTPARRARARRRPAPGLGGGLQRALARRAGRTGSPGRDAPAMPRTAAADGSSGSRSIDRNRNSSGQVMKSDARDGDSDVGKGSVHRGHAAEPMHAVLTDSLRLRVRASTEAPAPDGIARGPFAGATACSSPTPRAGCTPSRSSPGRCSTPPRAASPTTTSSACPRAASCNSDATARRYLALRPLLDDFVLSMPRGAQVIYPKDAARIVGLADLVPGARVAEAGVGSGALTCSLLRAVGDHGRGLQLRAARGLRRRRRGATSSACSASVPALLDAHRGRPGRGARRERDLDAVVLDMLAPWECVDAVGEALAPGGVLVGYVATTTQLSRARRDAAHRRRLDRAAGRGDAVRTWHLEGLAVRPDHRMNGHTGFLVTRPAPGPGAQLPPRRRRPAKGAYGEDYTRPRHP